MPLVGEWRVVSWTAVANPAVAGADTALASGDSENSPILAWTQPRPKAPSPHALCRRSPWLRLIPCPLLIAPTNLTTQNLQW